MATHLGDKRIRTPKICGSIAHAEEAGARDGHGGDAVDREVKENRGRRNDELDRRSNADFAIFQRIGPRADPVSCMLPGFLSFHSLTSLISMPHQTLAYLAS